MNDDHKLCLVTGGAGYFGGVLVNRLQEESFSVRTLDVNDPPTETEVQHFTCDIRDAAGVRAACEGVSTIYHCVAQVPLAKDKSLLWSVNRDGTRNLLQAAKDCGARKVIYISSSAVFGVPSAVPITPETKPKPAELYGAAKLEGERLCRDYAEQGLDVSIVRPRTILGHGRLGIMQLVFEWIFQGRNVFVLGRGDNLYQFVHADDLADACIKAANRPGFAEYNIGAERFGTMRETLEALVKHARSKSRVRSLPHGPTVLAMRISSALRISPLAAYHHLVYGKDVYFDIEHAKESLNWAPRWSNADMFCQSYDWYVAHRDEIFQAKRRSAHCSPVKEGVLKLLRWI